MSICHWHDEPHLGARTHDGTNQERLLENKLISATSAAAHNGFAQPSRSAANRTKETPRANQSFVSD
jgi:hypothetical protein